MTNTTGGDEVDVDAYAEDLEDERNDVSRTNSTRNSFPEDEPPDEIEQDAGTEHVEPTDGQLEQMDARQQEDDNRTDGGVDA